MGSLGALGVAALMAASGLAVLALAFIVVYTVKDFDVLIGAGPDSALSRALPAVIALALAVGLAQGLLLRSRAPETHARIGLGNEAFQLEKAAGGDS